MSRARRRAASRGFTLTELMVVVIIVGVLAAIGISSFRARVFGSKTTGAFAMVQAIRAAEERYRAENLTYLNVTRSPNWYPADPVGRVFRSFYNSGACGIPLPDTDDCRWKLLNPTNVGPTDFGFRVNAGPPSVAMTEPDTKARPSGWAGWPAATEHWYVIQAVADADGDAVYSKLVSSSLTPEIAHENDGE